MGDVFKAMNRAARERSQASAPSSPEAAAPASPAANGLNLPADPEAPALPMADVEAAALAPEDPPVAQPLPPVKERPATMSAPPPAKPAPTTSPTAAALQRASEPKAQPQPAVAVAAEAATSADRAAQVTAIPATARPAAASLNGYSPEVVVHHDRGSVITEQYRAIRTQILARARNRRLQLHVVTSSAPQEGKSVTTVNLGMAFSELRNQRTLLVEGDLRRPAFHKYFRRKPEPGLLHYLRGKTDDIDSIIHPSAHDNLQVIPAGDREFTSSTELLSSPRMAQLLDRLRDRYEHIFIDTPPVITVTDACILGAMADETLLVVRLNRTPTEVVDRAKRLLRAANCDVAGVILTHMRFHIPNYLYRYV
jgi:capsular exopolysaccharide synthesis family protein